MPSLTSKYPTAPNWSAGARVTAASSLPILVTNPDKKKWLYGAVTDDLTAPTTIDPTLGEGIVIKQGENFSMTLASGQTFWMAKEAGGSSAFALVTV
jgi:hypothetical protein